MSAVVQAAPRARLLPETVENAVARVALLGTGTVGSALLRRLAQWDGAGPGTRLRLVHVANSRHDIAPEAALHVDMRDVGIASMQVRAGPAPLRRAFERVTMALGSGGTRIVIDATASDDVAGQHANWLAHGIHVVTACKLGQGTDLLRWRAIQDACVVGGTHYGDSATVGAGLPLLRSIRDLRAGGDRIHAIAGVLSGSLAWLFHRYDGTQPFSGFVREAREAGYTEPDPREDLSGEDVCRKLLILARSAGVVLEADAVAVESLLPATMAGLPLVSVDAGLSVLDMPLRARFDDARKQGGELRFVARLQDGRARVGLEVLPAGDPLLGGSGTDNRVAIWSDRYREQPLLIQGPGAGAGVTAAALLDDALRIQSRALGMPE